MIFFLPLFDISNGGLSRSVAGEGWIVGNGCAADGISPSMPLAGSANSTSERRVGREALAGRPDCGWFMA